MKKYGKYSKQPEAKSALLQTYFTSLLSLVLCVAMFLGTSYAWFVSEVNNPGNEIYIGILDASLEKKLPDGSWVSLAVSENAQEKVTLFDKNIRWEPGFTTLETVKVTNKGDLAFKYVLSFTDGILEKGGAPVETAGKLAEIAKDFDVWVYEHTEQNKDKPMPTRFAEITAADSGWTKAATLDQLLAGEPVLAGTMDQVRKAGQDANAVNPDTTDGLKTEKIHTIALHMNEDAQATGMGHKINLNVKMVAYQMVAEQDGFGNGNYDEQNYVSTTEGLLKAVAEAKDGDVIAVAAGTYDLTAAPLVIEKSISLQGLNPADKPVLQVLAGANAAAIEVKADNVKLKDLILTVDPEKESAGNLVQILRKGTDKFYSDIVIDGCEFYGADHAIAFYGNNVTVRNCKLDGSKAQYQGDLLRVWGATGETNILNNTFLGNAQRAHGISFCEKVGGKISGTIRIQGNTFNNVNKAVVHASEMDYAADVAVEILDNRFENCLASPVSIDNGKFLSYKISGNLFLATTDYGTMIANGAGAAVEANGNYWGSENPVWSTVNSASKVTVKDYYTDEAKTNLKTK